MSDFKRQAKHFIGLHDYFVGDPFTHYVKTKRAFGYCGVDEGTASPRIAEVTCNACLTQMLHDASPATLETIQKLNFGQLHAEALALTETQATDADQLCFGIILSLLYEKSRKGLRSWNPHDFDDFCKSIP